MMGEMRRKEPEEAAEMGVVTISGDPAAVETRGEVRNLPVLSPGGYVWAPNRGEQVLVIKGGPGGEEACVVGRVQDGAALLPGEVLLYCGEASLKLDREGRVFLNGELFINGKPYMAPLTE